MFGSVLFNKKMLLGKIFLILKIEKKSYTVIKCNYDFLFS